MRQADRYKKTLDVGIVITAASAYQTLPEFIDYHIHLGFSKIYLFIDDNCALTYLKVQEYPQVTAFLKNEALIELWKQTPTYHEPHKKALIDIEVMIRQEMNFYVAYSKAREEGIDWLLHIDADELFYPNGSSVHEHFLKLQRNNINCITYLNYESITTEPDSKSIYAARHFKKNYLRHKFWIYSSAQRELITNTPWIRDKVFNYYQNGKSAVRTQDPSVKVYDVHAIMTPGERICARDKDPIILHFPCATRTEFQKKYKTLGKFPTEWMGADRAGEFIERVHLEARDVYLSGNLDALDDFYEKTFIYDESKIQLLIENNLAIEIDYHKNVFNQINSAFDISPTKSQSIDNEWRKWIAENIIFGAKTDALIQSLVNAGFTEWESKREVNLAINSPYLKGTQRLKNRLDKRDWILNCQNRLARLRPQNIDRRHKLSREEFLHNYYSVNQPVIISGMMDDWPARQKWNYDFFQENFGDRDVEVQFDRNTDRNYEVNNVSHKKIMRFGDYVDLIKNTSYSNNFYMTANNGSTNRRALSELWDDIIQVPEYLAPSEENNGFFWFGPAGTITPFHHDLTNNFMAQVMGRKRLKIMYSHETPNVYNNYHCFSDVDGSNINLMEFPNMENAHILECILSPGEILFLPIGCWHFVEGLDTSVTVSFTNFLWCNDFHSNYPEALAF